MAIAMDRRDLLVGLAAGYVVALSGCETNPDIGRRQLILISGLVSQPDRATT